jgi:catechol 2,3-dioxygenase-like lactoylglutathione lyase family enzyme
MNDMLEGMLETALYADDLDKAEAFYEGILGLDKISRVANRHVFYRCGPGVLLIFNPEETIEPPLPHGAKGPGHACFRVSASNFDSVKQKLQLAGIEIEAEVNWPNGARSIYFRDPDGNSLECAEPKLWGL